jgi:hypothetical protein
VTEITSRDTAGKYEKNVGREIHQIVIRINLIVRQMQQLGCSMAFMRLFDFIREKPTTVAIVLLSVGIADFVIIWLLVAK